MMNVRRAKKGWFKMSKRRNHSPQFKAKLAVEALKEERTAKPGGRTTYASSDQTVENGPFLE
jgi:hypothetical protein